MLKHVVKYTDPLTDVAVEETLHFNLSKAELAEKVLVDQSWPERLQAIAEREDAKELIDTVKGLIRESYGEVVEIDGKKRFMKSDAISGAFVGSEAYSTFFFQLISDPTKTIDFVNGIMPAEFMENVEQPKFERPQPKDRLPKRVKQVELPEEDIEIDNPQRGEVDDASADRLKELEALPVDGLTLDELIELKTLQG